MMPVLARDGATFCWYAQGLAANGISYLNDPQAQQHPLYPALILIVQQGLVLIGVEESPLRWQIAGQLISFISGALVVWLMIRVTREIAQQLSLVTTPQTLALVAGLLTAWLPLHVHLSVDVLSDAMHLALYLLGIDQILRLRAWPAALGAGLAAGLAFLVRPEGGAIALGAASVLLAMRNRLGWSAMLWRGACLGFGVILCVAPYWVTTGSISLKKNPVEWLLGEEVAVVAPDQNDALAKLETVELPPAAVPFSVAYQTGRAGRLLLPLLGLMGLLLLRRFLFQSTLIGLMTCGMIHFSLLVWLQTQYHYLAPRHTLVLVVLITPAAAYALLWILQQLSSRRSAQVGLCVGLSVPLLLYNLRIPNGGDGYLREVADWLVVHEPEIKQRRLMAGSGPLRVAFYTGAKPVRWHENDQVTAEQIATQMIGEQADYFVIELGSGFEQMGNDERLKMLKELPELKKRLTEIRAIASQGHPELRIYRIEE